MRSIPSLDGLRAISICLVIAAHLHLLGDKSDVLGSLGVRVFFVISGFLITSILLREMSTTGSIDMSRFYIRRTLRIFPAFYVFLATLAALAYLGVISLHPFDLTRAGLYVSNYYPWDSQSIFVRHTWSLSNEEQFYLLWPACLLFAGIRTGRWIALAVIMIEPFIRLGIMVSNGSAVATLDRRFDCVADTMATGCFLACVRQALSDHPGYLKLLSSPAFVIVPVLTVLAAATNLHPHIYYLVAFTFVNIGIALCIDRSIRHPGDFSGKLLNSAPFRAVGVMSYSLYLWQQLFISDGHEWWRTFPTNVGLSFAAAATSYFLIEGPFQRLKNRIPAAL